jgi:hypothetical protein
MEQAILAATAHARSYTDTLRAIIGTQVRYFGDHVHEVVALGQIFTHARDDPGVSNLAAASRRSTLTELEDMFRQGQELGEFGDFAPRPMSVSLLAALEAVPVELFAQPDTEIEVYASELAVSLPEVAPPPGRAGE